MDYTNPSNSNSVDIQKAKEAIQSISQMQAVQDLLEVSQFFKKLRHAGGR